MSEKDNAAKLAYTGLSAISIGLLVGAALSLSGCGLHIDIPWYGVTPVGYDHRLATSLRAQPVASAVKTKTMRHSAMVEEE